MGTKIRVSLSVGLLIGAKVSLQQFYFIVFPFSSIQVLNVQVPFYFKSIVDSMNIDFLAIGGTAWTVAGSMIVACMCVDK